MLCCVLVHDLASVQFIHILLTQDKGLHAVRDSGRPEPFIQVPERHPAITAFVSANPETIFRRRILELGGQTVRCLKFDGHTDPFRHLEELRHRQLPGGILFGDAAFWPLAEEVDPVMDLIEALAPAHEVGRFGGDPQGGMWHPHRYN